MASTQYWMYGASDFAGLRFYSPTQDGFNPTAVGPTLQGVPSVIPTVYPPNSPATVSPAGGPASPANTAAVQAAGANPFSFTSSPLILLGVFLVVALLGLRYIHFKG